jgi:hypothetical protein
MILTSRWMRLWGPVELIECHNIKRAADTRIRKFRRLSQGVFTKSTCTHRILMKDHNTVDSDCQHQWVTSGKEPTCGMMVPGQQIIVLPSVQSAPVGAL